MNYFEEFKKAIFPVKNNEKIEKMSGEKILKLCNSNACDFFKKHTDTTESFPIFTYLALNDLYSNLDRSEKKIVDDFYYELPTKDIKDNLHYVNGLMYYGFTSLIDDLIIFYEPLIPINPFRCEEIVYYMNDKYTTNNYEKALNFTHFAEMIYKKCPKDERHLYLVAKYGLLAYDLKNDWLNLWKVKPVIRLDYFWISLCNVLKKLKRYDEAIDIAKTGIKYDAYDISNGGWQSRLEKLQKAKEKYN